MTMTMVSFRILALLVAGICMMLGPTGGSAEIDSDRYAVLLEPVRARDLGYDEKRFLQLSLAFQGRYLGLLDGDWGPRSQAAFDRYAREEFDAPAVNLHLAALVFNVAEQILDSGWDMLFLDRFGVSFLFPFDAYTIDDPGEVFINWHHSKSSLAISAARSDLADAVAFHGYFLGKSMGADPYTLRRDTRLVTSVRTADGLLYARSDLVNRGWTTIVLFADRTDEGILTAVSSSLTPGRASPIRFPEGGFLDHIVTLFLEVADEDTAPSAAGGGGSSAQAARPAPQPAGSSGSGFVVNRDGQVMTNAHVVDDCQAITANGRPARLMATSDIFDLAVLNSDALKGAPHAVFAAAPARLNEDVLAAGFPLSDVLDGLNVTRGVVSSLKGLKGDSFNMQISAAVQAGNSGGPLLDASGRVVGVVVAKLRQDVVAQSTGSVPENVNFAVRGEIAKLFLAQNAVPFDTGAASDAVDAARLGEIASDVTVYIECRR